MTKQDTDDNKQLNDYIYIQPNDDYIQTNDDIDTNCNMIEEYYELPTHIRDNNRNNDIAIIMLMYLCLPIIYVLLR